MRGKAWVWAGVLLAALGAARGAAHSTNGPVPPWDPRLYEALGGKGDGLEPAAPDPTRVPLEPDSGANPTGPAGAARLWQLTEMHADTSLDVAVGDRIEIALDGRPASGFQWVPQAGKDTVIRPQGEPRFSPYRPVLGSGGTHHFEYRAVAPGVAGLVLAYVRTGAAPPAAPARTFRLRVVVRRATPAVTRSAPSPTPEVP